MKADDFPHFNFDRLSDNKCSLIMDYKISQSDYRGKRDENCSFNNAVTKNPKQLQCDQTDVLSVTVAIPLSDGCIVNVNENNALYTRRQQKTNKTAVNLNRAKYQTDWWLAESTLYSRRTHKNYFKWERFFDNELETEEYNDRARA